MKKSGERHLGFIGIQGMEIDGGVVLDLGVVSVEAYLYLQPAARGNFPSTRDFWKEMSSKCRGHSEGIVLFMERKDSKESRNLKRRYYWIAYLVSWWSDVTCRNGGWTGGLSGARNLF